MSASTSSSPEPSLSIPADAVCFVVAMLREYENAELLGDAADNGVEQGSPLDAEDVDVYTRHENDCRNEPVRHELESFINDLPEDQQIELVALMWLGRDNGSAEDWPSVLEDAAHAHNERTAPYLLGSPLASDFIEEGLAALGFCGENIAAAAKPDISRSEP
ncbi:MAG TPA: DUF3775 domain-containing protein [Dyella sp.]|uniref:DUF3775 domain-containing protein n=1 Tax=Dyella sp. TaxID=1869338 RepID=UPI002C262DE0|nr:DUF3775 domain-containing protein [Dyella sp.]HUB90194.1 DUF3775 domain-containing protein [Dyella sp.]